MEKQMSVLRNIRTSIMPGKIYIDKVTEKLHTYSFQEGPKEMTNVTAKTSPHHLWVDNWPLLQKTHNKTQTTSTDTVLQIELNPFKDSVSGIWWFRLFSTVALYIVSGVVMFEQVDFVYIWARSISLFSLHGNSSVRFSWVCEIEGAWWAPVLILSSVWNRPVLSF